MRRSVVICACLLAVPVATAQAAPGDLDETFSRDGLLLDREIDDPQALATQPDGSILVLGVRDHGPSFPLIRYLRDGTRDPLFGVGGAAQSPIPAAELAALPDGSLLAGGTVPAATGTDLAVARLNPDGSPDTSYGAGGTARASYGEYDGLRAIAQAPDGGAVILGTAFDGATEGISITRLTPAGGPEPGFSGDGKVFLTGPAIPPEVAATLLRPDGSIVVAGGGDALITGTGDMQLVAIESDGNLDPSFGAGGVATVDFGGGERASDLVRQPGGALVAAGPSCPDLRAHAGFCRSVGARFTPDGQLDSSFGEHGRLELPTGAALALRADGELVVGGVARIKPATTTDLAVTSLGDAGAPDDDFGVAGTAAADFDLAQDFGFAVAAGADDHIVVMGISMTQSFDFRLAIARFELPDGPADADGDGMKDARDRCQHRFAGHRTGCPRIPRQLTLDPPQRGRISGDLTPIPLPAARDCAARKPVTLRQRTPGRDRSIGRTRTSGRRAWALPKGDAVGHLYVLSPRTIEPGLGRCAPARIAVSADD